MLESQETPFDTTMYPMQLNKEGFIGNAIIFVMHKFKDKDKAPREGALRERKNLIKIAELWCFKPCVFMDATGEEIDETLDFITKPPKERPRQISEEIWEARIQAEHQSILVAVVSHGNADCFLTADEISFPDRDIELYLNESRCRLLSGKPKLILFNKCRIFDVSEPPPDAEPPTRISLGSDETLKYDTYLSSNSSTYSNFLKIFSCSRGTYSLRNTHIGSFVLSALPDAYEKYGNGMELRKFFQIFRSHMLKEVHEKVKSRPDLATATQCITVEESLLSDVFLPRAAGPRSCESLEEMEVEQSHGNSVRSMGACDVNIGSKMNINEIPPKIEVKPRFLRRVRMYKKAQHTFKPGGRKSRIKRLFSFLK